MKGPGPSEERPSAPIHPPRFPRWLIAVEAFLAIAIVACGVWASTDQLHVARKSAENDLLAVGRLKAGQIVDWRKERLSDAGIIQGSRPFGELVARWLDSKQPADAAQILSWFQTIAQESGYADIRLVDASGRVLLDANGNGGSLPADAQDGLHRALASGKVVSTDLHFVGGGKTAYLDIVAPLLGAAAPEGQPIGAVVLSADAGSFLFPLLQTWPTDSASAETLLVERDGDQVLFLNELRFRSGTALDLRFPLSQGDLPAVRAVLGAQGVVEGVDYRGVKVIGAAQSIPGSPWFIVAKIDISEALAAAKARAWLVAGAFALLLVALLGGTELYWQQGLKRRYREAYELEALRLALLARYEHLVQRANDIIFVLDAGRRIVEANERAVEGYGYSREELLALQIEDLVPPSEVPALRARLGLLEQEDSCVAEAVHQRKDGSVFPAEVSGRSIEIDGRKYVHMIARDIGDRKRAETELALIGFSVNHASDSVFWLDRDGRIIFVSDSTCERHGYPRDELLKMTVFDLDPSLSKEHWAENWRAITSEGAMRLETTHRTKEGDFFPVEVRGDYVQFGGAEYDCVFARDITERRQAEASLRERDEQLRQSQKMEAVGQLAGGIAHDFNNLLAAVVGYSDLLLAREGAFDLSVREDIEEIRRAADRASSLTKQILAFSRRQALRPTVASLNVVLEGMGPLLRRTLGENIDLVTLEYSDLGLVDVDIHQFEQVLLNLAVNARDAMPSGGRLTLETANVELDQDYCRTHPDAAPGPHVMMAVSDTGTGMDEATLEHIFEPFFTTKARDKGTGLGLSMVYGTVKQSNGSISVSSEQGKGTSFKVYLPRVAAKVQDVAPLVTHVGSGRGSGTILVVEDEVSLRKVVVRVLEDLGYRVAAAGTGAEAVQALKQEGRAPDLLLTDVVLPGDMQGDDLAREFVAAMPGLAVLYMSGYTRNAIVHAGRLDPEVHFLEKPFTPEALGTAVQEALGGRPTTSR